MKIIIGGALGRMGRQLTQAAKEAGVGISGGVDVAYTGQGTDFPVVTGFDLVSAPADVLIDFSRPEGLYELLALCCKWKMPVVLCATGYTDVEIERIKEAARLIPVFRSANMSLGVNVLSRLCAIAARALGEDYDVEIVEKHHRMKVDSPSGTALMLLSAIEKETGSQREPVYGRYGRAARRQPGEIGVHAIRGGTVTGEHEVGFYGNGEEILLTHRAENRSLFAQGALRAAGFLMGKPAGLYEMQNLVDDILGLQ